VARFALIVALAATLVAGGGVAGGRSVAKPVGPRNEIIAAIDAEAHLSRLALPADAVRSDREPAGEDGTLSSPLAGPPATPNVVDDHSWWVLSESPSSVLQYARAHPPRGGRAGLSGASSGGGRPSVTGIGFSWPALPGRLSTRWLMVEVVRLREGSTGLRADSQVVWITPRPASEHIPAGSRRLVLTTTRFGHVIQGPLTIRSLRSIRRAVRLLNALPAAQPGTTACPFDGGSQIRLAFYRSEDTGTGAQALAVAKVDPGGCGLVSLTIRGRGQPPLAGGFTLARRLSHALGVRVDPGAMS
jgi:hypothetical protein